MFITSVKQLARTPGKAILFVLLIAGATMLMVFGAALLTETTQKIAAVEEQFTTIGMVEQIPATTRNEARGDSCQGQYTVVRDVYDELIPIDVLNFEGAEYIQPPENRTYYMAALNAGSTPFYSRIYSRRSSERYSNIYVAEIIPLEDSRGTGPIKAQVGAVLFDGSSRGSMYSVHRTLRTGDAVNFCQHYAESPVPLVKGKKYMANMAGIVCDKHHLWELVPYQIPYSSQYNADGTSATEDADTPGVHLSRREEFVWIANRGSEKYPTDFSSVAIPVDEASDDFSMGDWVTWANLLRNDWTYFPVLATNALELLPSFHEHNAYIVDGRAITQEEFDSGAKVCMIPSSLKVNQMYYVGDSLGKPVTIPLYCTLYGYPAEKAATGPNPFLQYYSMLSADGQPYRTFFIGEYEVVGTYTKSTYNSRSMELSEDTLIIPAKSVSRTGENIAYYGPMTKATASFQIANGTVEEFDKKFRATVPEAARLNITYDDNGYADVMPALNKLFVIAVLLFSVGVAAATAVVVLLLYFFIVKEKKRTAIERSLGMTKHQCRVSLLAGVMVLALLGTALGSGCGALAMRYGGITGRPGTKATGREYAGFSTQYSEWARNQGNIADIELDKAQVKLQHAAYFSLPLLLLAVIWLLALVMVNRSMEIEPLLLLNQSEE